MAARKKHGGRRAGAGAKKSVVKKTRAQLGGDVTEILAPHLGKILGNLMRLADGGYERVKEELEPAGRITVEDVVRDAAGDVILGPNGRPTKIKVKAFPDKDDDEWVCVRRTVEIADADREANKTLLDRLLGKVVTPIQALDGEGLPIKAYIGFNPEDV